MDHALLPDLIGAYSQRRGAMRSIAQLLALLAIAGISSGFGQTLTGSQSVALSLSPSAVLYSVPSALILASSGSFGIYTGSLTVNLEIRTSVLGSGNLGLQATSEFTPTTGPAVASGNLTYQCSAATYGTACSGQVQASTTNQTNVASFVALSCTGGGGACSNSDPNSVSVQFTVPDNPDYKTGTYSSTITFTVSAT